MNKYRRTQSSIFLLEIIINILMFSVLLVVGLSFIIRAHTLTNNTRLLHRAVAECNNVATLYENSDGNLDLILNEYPYCTNTGNQIFIYYDSDVSPCQRENSLYYISFDTATNPEEDIKAGDIFSKEISFYDEGSSAEIYSLTVTSYKRLTPSSKEVLE